jgi:hypothetical protein
MGGSTECTFSGTVQRAGMLTSKRFAAEPGLSGRAAGRVDLAVAWGPGLAG